MASSPSSKRKTEGRTSSAAKKSDNPKNPASKRTPSLTEQMIKLHENFKNQKKAHRKSVRSDIVKAVDIGLALKKNKKEWEKFCKKDWGKTKAPREDQIDQAVRFAIKYMVGPGEAAQKKASFYYNAVIDLVNKGLEGKVLEKRLKNDGLKKLAKNHTLEKKEKSSDSHEPVAISATGQAKNIAPKASRLEQIDTVKEQISLSKREETLKGREYDWRAILRFEKPQQGLTNIKVGQIVHIKAVVKHAGPTLILVVSKTKVKVAAEPD